jgi:DNA replication protein DnaC
MSALPLTNSLPSFEPPLNSSSGDSLIATSVEAASERMQLTCPKHGKFESWRVPNRIVPNLNDCPRCLEEQQAERDREGREKAARQMRAARLKKLVDLASIPARFRDRTLDDYRVTNPGQQLAVGICRAYAATWEDQYRKGGSLVLTGSPGTGKTHLACAIANRIMHEHLASVAFGAVSAVTRTVRATYGKNSDRTETQAIADLLVPDLLIIDEVGASTGSDHELQLLFEIINKRYENLRPMLVISNLNTDDLQKFLGHRAMDRFRECGTVVAFDWASHRGQVGAA